MSAKLSIGDGSWDIPPLPVSQIANVVDEQTTHRKRWLVDELWGEKAVGLIGGVPKSFKTFLGLDLAVSVASGTPALGHFPVECRGPVLIYLAEDALGDLQDRVSGICSHRGLDLATSSLRRPCASTARSIRLASLTPSSSTSPASSCSTRASASTASTKTRAVTSPVSSVSSARCSDNTRP